MNSVCVNRSLNKRPEALKFKATGQVKKSFKDECDINHIIKRYQANGVITHLNDKAAVYGDVSDIPDYATSLGVVNQANALFMSLPSGVRFRFQNRPEAMIEFLKDGKNRDEAIRLGLINAPVSAASVAPVVPVPVPGPGPTGPVPPVPVK